MESLTNNTIQPLAIDQLWTGISEFRNNTVTIAVNLITTKNCIVTVSQATDNVNFVFTDNFAHDVAIIGTQSRFQVSAKAQFMKVSVLNDSGEEIPQIVVTTYFNDVNIDSTLEQPVIVAGSVNVLNSMKATNYEFDTLRNVACDDTGKLLTIHSPSGTQDVSVTSRSGTGLLSYLTDNVAVATQPALVFSTDKVDVTGSSVAVSSLPAITLSKTTSSITTYENASLIVSFDSDNTVRNIKTSAGSLQSLSLVNDNNAIGFISLYNLLAVDVNVVTSIPLAVIVVQKNQAIQLVTHNLAFSTALSFFTATTYGGPTPLTNVYVSALYDS